MGKDEDTTVQYLRNCMREFVRERNWERFHNPKNLAGSIAIEAAELLTLFQWLTVEEAYDKSNTDEELREEIRDELADVLLYLLSLANALNIDVAQSVLHKLDKNRRKYPLESIPLN